ncbi:MAG: hypothetical protein ACXVSJ_16770 [Solirubrobacteraceae bacterium]
MSTPKPPAMHPFANQAEKTLYAVRMARLGRWPVSVSGDDYCKRVLGLSVLIHLKAFLDHAPQLKNKLGTAGVNVSDCEAVLSRLRKDFDTDYKWVRDKLGAPARTSMVRARAASPAPRRSGRR